MPIPPSATLAIYSGDDFAQSFQFKNPDGTPLTLTGIWRATFRPEPSAPVSVPFTVDTSAQATGQITVTMAGSLTSTLNSFGGCWDLEQTSSGVVRTWLSGPVSWVQDVSR